jgi:hypothetical protein
MTEYRSPWTKAARSIEEAKAARVDLLAANEFGSPADVYFSRSRGRTWNRQRLSFRRFDTLAEAVRYAVEDLPNGLEEFFINVEDQRLDRDGARRLYESDAYPMVRRLEASR